MIITTDRPAARNHQEMTGPRYTSYPTAPHFGEFFTLDDWQKAVCQSNQRGAPLSLYLHIPFCSTVCFYCGCNRVITADRTQAERYLASLQTELSLQAEFVGESRTVAQMHWGGGTPTYLTDLQITDLFATCRKHFRFAPDGEGEYSIEIHPQTVDAARLNLLRRAGFNRLSLGVQDFAEPVQQAVNRYNREDEVAALLAHARALNYHSVNVDLIYGLPHQTEQSFATTLTKIIAMRPDRLSIFNYAHMPHLFKMQRRIDASTLPSAEVKQAIFSNSIQQLLASGYLHIGMDHFALPGDALALAQQAGTLKRNFQGYTTGAECDLLAFGVSSINSVGNTYAQNIKSVADYCQALEREVLPISKGFVLSRDDEIRRDVIQRLICDEKLVFADLAQRWDISFTAYFANELDRLAPMINDGLVQRTGGGLQLTNSGRLLARRVCMVFDAYLKEETTANPPRYSRIV